MNWTKSMVALCSLGVLAFGCGDGGETPSPTESAACQGKCDDFNDPVATIDDFMAFVGLIPGEYGMIYGAPATHYGIIPGHELKVSFFEVMRPNEVIEAIMVMDAETMRYTTTDLGIADFHWENLIVTISGPYEMDYISQTVFINADECTEDLGVASPCYAAGMDGDQGAYVNFIDDIIGHLAIEVRTEDGVDYVKAFAAVSSEANQNPFFDGDKIWIRYHILGNDTAAADETQMTLHNGLFMSEEIPVNWAADDRLYIEIIGLTNGFDLFQTFDIELEYCAELDPGLKECLGEQTFG